MRAARVHQFGGLDAIVVEDLPRPIPGEGQVLARVKAAGVGPWDAWVRAGRSALTQPLPLILDSDLSGVVEAVGPGVSDFHPGEGAYGVTNSRFTGAYAECAVVFLVAVISEGLTRIADLFDSGHLMTNVGGVLPLAEARRVHEMLAGAPYKRGKIVLTVGV